MKTKINTPKLRLLHRRATRRAGRRALSQLGAVECLDAGAHGEPIASQHCDCRTCQCQTAEVAQNREFMSRDSQRLSELLEADQADQQQRQLVNAEVLRGLIQHGAPHGSTPATQPAPEPPTGL